MVARIVVVYALLAGRNATITVNIGSFRLHRSSPIGKPGPGRRGGARRGRPFRQRERIGGFQGGATRIRRLLLCGLKKNWKPPIAFL
jgi:hypothetical protein